MQQTIETGNFVNIGNRAGFTFHDLYWVFIDADNPTIPIIVDEEPIYTRASDNRRRNRKAWFDIDRQEWNFSGVTQSGRRTAIPIGIVSTGYQARVNLGATLISKSFDFNREYKKDNTIRLRQRSAYVFESEDETSKASVYGRDIVINQRLRIEVGGTPGNGTCLYFYLTEAGLVAVEWNTPPVYRDDLKGYYHPSRSHRCIGHYVVGNRPEGISWKYSNNERYKSQYNIFARVSGTATRDTNDITINNSRDGYLLKNIFSLIRDAVFRGSGLDFSKIFFVMTKNQLFKEYGTLLESSDTYSHLPTVGHSFRDYGTFNGVKYFSVGNAAVIDPIITANSSGGIRVSINRYGNDAIEKELWNKLS